MSVCKARKGEGVAALAQDIDHHVSNGCLVGLVWRYHLCDGYFLRHPIVHPRIMACVGAQGLVVAWWKVTASGPSLAMPSRVLLPQLQMTDPVC